MNRAVRELRIKTYRDQLTACNEVRAVLSKELESPDLLEVQFLALGHRLDQATKESVAIHFMLDRLEQEESAESVSKIEQE